MIVKWDKIWLHLWVYNYDAALPGPPLVDLVLIVASVGKVTAATEQNSGHNTKIKDFD